MKLKKINKHGDYVVVMSQVEINFLNEIVAFVNHHNLDYPNVHDAYNSTNKFLSEYSTFELEGVFDGVIVDADEDTPKNVLVELHPTKDLLVP